MALHLVLVLVSERSTLSTFGRQEAAVNGGLARLLGDLKQCTDGTALSVPVAGSNLSNSRHSLAELTTSLVVRSAALLHLTQHVDCRHRRCASLVTYTPMAHGKQAFMCMHVNRLLEQHHIRVVTMLRTERAVCREHISSGLPSQRMIQLSRAALSRALVWLLIAYLTVNESYLPTCVLGTATCSAQMVTSRYASCQCCRTRLWAPTTFNHPCIVAGGGHLYV